MTSLAARTVYALEKARQVALCGDGICLNGQFIDIFPRSSLVDRDRSVPEGSGSDMLATTPKDANHDTR